MAFPNKHLAIPTLLGILIMPWGEMASGKLQAPQQAQASLPRCPASFLTDAVVDLPGNLWVASEGQGLWRLPPGGSWEQMDKTAGFPQDSSNIYALTVDAQGRVWAGTAHKGVAVWNGREWKTYNRLNGLAGDRIFDIQSCPGTGNVAVATSGGLSVYNPSQGSWISATRAEGLAENQIESLAFTRGGGLVAAYQCGGVGFSSPENGWKKWNNIQAPWHWDEKKRVYQPGEMYGTGLPSNQCNAIKAAGNGVWAGTSCGLAWLNQGKWLYVRGKDAQGKNKGIHGGLPSVLRKTGFPSELKKPELLPEDYITALLPCREGLWIGFRKEGAVLWDPVEMKVIKRALNKQRSTKAKWVREFVVYPNGEVYACTNGGGLQKVGETAKYRVKGERKEKTAPHPKEAPAPDVEGLPVLETEGARKTAAAGTGVMYAGEDWATRGDWCGHYGQDAALLCAVNAPYNDSYFSTRYPDLYQPDAAPRGGKILQIDIRGYMGLHKGKKDFLRGWCHKTSWPENRNVLYCPEVGTRTEAEWDDHGEAYAPTFDGPDIWVVTDIPEGLHEVALYFYNPNAREGNAGYRDYLIEARSWKPKYPDYINFLIQGNRMRILEKREPPAGGWWKNLEKRKEELFAQQARPPEARTRVKDFGGNGVYKRFLVKGPVSCSFTVKRNSSFNTIVNGIFVTRLDAKYETYDILAPDDPYIPTTRFINIGDDLPLDTLSLWSSAQMNHLPSPSAWDRAERKKLAAYRSLAAFQSTHPDHKACLQLLRVWKFGLRLWDQEQRQEFDEACRRSWAHLQKSNVIYRSKEWRPYSPNVLPLSKEELSAMKELGIDWKSYLPGATPPPEKSLEELKNDLKNNQQQTQPTPNEDPFSMDCNELPRNRNTPQLLCLGE